MAANKSRILIVDDHSDTRELMQVLLRRLGYDTAVAGSIEEAVTAAGTQKFDLLLTDMGLPDGNGLDLLARLKPMGVACGIALTGHGRQSDIEAAEAAGFSAHLLKPVDFQRLQKAVAEALA